ncbi:tyrosine-type recombinase/integrase [Candidatus Magnetobacterium casense]|uniref:Site-specific integrase n=1 Tax=Candidatus Magnetobacterium casense TaxID=1455061 RepID=A0ABS6RZV1_9BACT|nr:site-specific integrase [Candidatus Magnetobacterium casensis]MBV6342132.1 site-specific integrase [Candidatus Magnetobacterium casensis]
MKSVDGMRLFKRDDNGIWYVQIDRTHKRSLQTRDEREAKMRFIALQREAVKGKLVVLDRTPTMSLQELSAAYLEWCGANRAVGTWKRAKQALQKLMGVIGQNKQLADIRKKDMDAYVVYCTAIKNKSITINGDMNRIKSAFSWAFEREYLKVNPFIGCKRLRVQNIPPKFLSEQQIQSVYAAIGDNRMYRLIFSFYIHTGGRRAEVQGLQWADIQEDGIVFRKTKTYKSRKVPISEGLKKTIKEHGRGVGRVFQVKSDTITHTMKNYFKKAGVGDFRVHDLRHTFASLLVQKGISLQTVQELLGHSSYNTTLIYAHLSQRHLQDAIAKIEY